LLPNGTIVEGYRIDGVLGEGGMGAVYQATQLSLNRTVALKLLSTELTDDPTFRERFRREGQLQAKIDHPHIVTVYEAGETEHGLYLAMRLVKGPTLKDLILTRALDPERSVRILLAVADALDTAHGVGLIHRDIKPQNILIGEQDHTYLADFGLTKAPDEAGLTDTGQFVGTIDYVAPEQVQGQPASTQTDVYQLAGVLYESLTGAVPFERPTEAAVMYAHVQDPPPRLREVRPDLPKELDEVVVKGMAKDPTERQESAGELMRSAFRAFRGPAGEVVIPTPGQLTKPAQAVPTDLRPGVTAQSPGATAQSRAPTAAGAAPTEAASAMAGDVTTARGQLSAAGMPTAAAGTTPAAPPRERGLPVPLLGLGVGLAVIAAVVGFVAGNSGSSSSDTTAADLGSSASAGSLSLSFPDDWNRVAEKPGVPGLALGDVVVLAPTGDRVSRLAAGMADATGPKLLSARFRAELSAPATGQPVKLGKLEALNYSGLQVKGLNDRLNLYTVPTDQGVATVACRSRGSVAQAFLADCERSASSLEVTGAKTFPIGPSSAYAQTLGSAIRKLNSAQRSGVAKLRKAKTRSGQASAARALSKPYATAARSLRNAEVSPADEGANGPLVAALADVSKAYSRMASAASKGSSGSYKSASRAVTRGEARVKEELQGLEALGYTVR
jgi:protein kinase-like protein